MILNDIHIEIKKGNSPDWCQSTIKYIDNRWTCNNKIINDYIKDIKLFNGNIPKFIIKQKLRIRIKVHSKNRNGFALLSVIISPKPIKDK